MDIKTRAIVLRRTNYGEADRILNLLTPEGKVSAIAKGVRREKSKLAGGIELFSTSKITLHQGKSDLYTLTSARLETFYSRILSDYQSLELAYEILKSVSKKAEHIDNPEFFSITEQALAGLHSTTNYPLISIWWHLNLLRTSGDNPNFHTDTSGDILKPDQNYIWDPTDQSLRPTENGPITTPHIKLLRLILTNPLKTALQVENTDPLLPPLTAITRALPN